jgi:hypothetical protein
MIGRCDGDPLDAAHPDALNPGDRLIERPADPDPKISTAMPSSNVELIRNPSSCSGNR